MLRRVVWDDFAVRAPHRIVIDTTQDPYVLIEEYAQDAMGVECWQPVHRDDHEHVLAVLAVVIDDLERRMR